ncbi:MAG: FadR family transcriptional regulator [Candidatus Eremiobacteraeota bacterium]|nr:FadR family transcriptional regulator [Candidatus Eremiobacteraeota bacterium]
MMVSRAALLADEIEGAIAAGSIRTGHRLGTKDDLRQRYDVAYGTLNEALRILQQRGYVTSRTGPGGGLFATIPTSSDRLRHLLSLLSEGGTLKDCAEVRHALEEAIAVDATRHRARTDIPELEAIVAAMSAAMANAEAYLRENWRLHRRIAQCCRNRVLANLYITLLDANEPGPGVVAPDRERTTNAAENLGTHRELVDAIASGSAERARAAVARHERFFVPLSDRVAGARARAAKPAG